MLLVLAAHLIQPRHEFRQGPLALDQPLRDLAMQLFSGFDRLGRFPPLLLQIVGPGTERYDLATVAFDLFVQVFAAVAFVLDRRFLGGDAFAIGGNLGLAPANLFVDLRGLDVQGKHLGLGRFGDCQGSVALARQIADPTLDLGQGRLNRRQSTRPTCVRSSCTRSVCSLYRLACRPGPGLHAGGFPLRRQCPTIATGSVRPAPTVARIRAS